MPSPIPGRLGFACATLIVVLSGTSTQAQISPGPLAQAHEHLDSTSQCFACHGGKNRSAGINARCAECHAEIAWQTKNGAGLHGREELQDCSDCHPDHAGRNFELIEWVEGSRDAFDHQRTGWPLTEPHGKLACAKCHTKEFQGSDLIQLRERKNPDSSWLGLETDCASCHKDVHRGTLGSDCTGCHVDSGWRPASRFDHGRTKYLLDGKHVEVKCESCHKPTTTDEKVFAPLAHQQCSPCHEDEHRGNFGPDCSSCHVTGGFKIVRLGHFDHSKTQFPLHGKHRSLECSSCHDPATGGYKKKDFATCSSCHADAHAGTALWQDRQEDCGACHDERGFSPSTLTVEDHSKTKYPLEGAHRTVTCAACHTKHPADVKRLGTSGVRLQPTHSSCTDCHKYAHADQLDKRPDGGVCESCHSVSRWKPSTFGVEEHDALDFRLTGAHSDAECGECHGPERTDLPPLPGVSELGSAGVALTRLETRCTECHFDPHTGQIDGSCESCHRATGFRPSLVDTEMHRSFKQALEGAHRTVACVACHEELAQPPRRIHLLRADEGTPLVFSMPIATCSSCHESPHGGQFGNLEFDCMTCHDSQAFVPAPRFDHDRDAAFPLGGEHRKVACLGCHVREVGDDGVERVVYRPLAHDCKSCHRTGTVPEAGGTSDARGDR